MADAVFNIITSVNAVGAALSGNDFRYTICTTTDEVEYEAFNDINGLITFENLTFSAVGNYEFYISIAPLPNPEWVSEDLPEDEYLTLEESYPCWDVDTTTWALNIEITDDDGDLTESISYKDGTPHFINRFLSKCSTCGEIEFEELIFTEPGVYTYTVKELTGSSDGWTTDISIFEVVVTVVDDGYGNLVATTEYLEGFPTFENLYEVKPAVIIISGCKKAIGAPLPSGKFHFGLYDDENNLVATAANGPAPETPKV